MTIDITNTMVGKTDQLNAYDLLSGPRTIKIRAVKKVEKDQPLWIYFDGDNGKPWKPALTVRRILGKIWGRDAEKWIGLHCTIFCDETVPFGGAEVGGIRVSHMEGLTKPQKLSLATARNARKNFTVQPLVIEKQASKAEKMKARLFEIAQGDEKSVADVWGQVPDDVKTELGAEFYDQLVAIETAAQEHRENDPTAAVDSLNAALAGD